MVAGSPKFAGHPPDSFVDEQLEGPSRLWHRTHIFRSAEEDSHGRQCSIRRLPFGSSLGRLGRTRSGRERPTLNADLPIISSRDESSDLLGAPASAMSEAGGSLLWFRQDLRLADNPALAGRGASWRARHPRLHLVAGGRRPMAAGSGVPVVAAPVPGPTGRLAASARLPSDHPPRPGTRGDPRAAGTIGCDRSLLEPPVRTNGHRTRQRRESSPASRWADRRRALTAACCSSHGQYDTQKGQPYQVFSRVLESLPGTAGARPAGGRACSDRDPRRWPTTLNLADLGLEPTIDWAGGLRACWRPGEAGAADN